MFNFFTNRAQQCCIDYAKRGRDSRFFALNEMNLSIFDGDSSNEEEKSRISVIKQYAIV